MNEKTYFKNQSKSGFEIGNWVMVTRKATDYEQDWPNDWAEDMDLDLYKLHKIKGLYVHGIIFESNTDYSINPDYAFPFFVLEKWDEESAFSWFLQNEYNMKSGSAVPVKHNNEMFLHVKAESPTISNIATPSVYNHIKPPFKIINCFGCTSRKNRYIKIQEDVVIYKIEITDQARFDKEWALTFRTGTPGYEEFVEDYNAIMTPVKKAEERYKKYEGKDITFCKAYDHALSTKEILDSYKELKGQPNPIEPHIEYIINNLAKWIGYPDEFNSIAPPAFEIGTIKDNEASFQNATRTQTIEIGKGFEIKSGTPIIFRKTFMDSKIPYPMHYFVSDGKGGFKDLTGNGTATQHIDDFKPKLEDIEFYYKRSYKPDPACRQCNGTGTINRYPNLEPNGIPCKCKIEDKKLFAKYKRGKALIFDVPAVITVNSVTLFPAGKTSVTYAINKERSLDLFLSIPII